MKPTLPGHLVVPTFLAVTTLGACPGGDKTTMTTDGEASTTTPTSTATPTDPTTTGTTTTGTSTTTTGTTTTGTTMAPTTAATDTGGLADCSMYKDQAACMTEPDCLWFVEISACIADCEKITDQATCEMQDYCEWFDEQCSMLLA